ncbi:hypothetical protein NUU61_000026 [Penicillium alfredii]|uniref:Uncharacterized protein n=1 Tax=Penicillium alfredii TaxID=1506179 RepID=A0A9W9G955_9EURO|nr:uncharacterized protein NUU61_000026 [Penicillium alfredii]KAJ5114267.1 hypothetical protein NUU61_000026 [Penicillium alfredii]
MDQDRISTTEVDRAPVSPGFVADESQLLFVIAAAVGDEPGTIVTAGESTERPHLNRVDAPPHFPSVYSYP